MAEVSLSRAPPAYDLVLELFPGAAKADAAEDKVAFGTSQSCGPSLCKKCFRRVRVL